VVLHTLLCSGVLCSVALAGCFASPVDAASSMRSDWIRPVEGPVTRPFDPPANRFGAGHLGVDFRAAAGTPVRAAGPGEVTVAGSVAGALHVVVAHAGGLRTSYSFLASVSVRRGQRVRAGEVVGTSGGTGHNHDGSVVHLGLRSGSEYIDPMLLFGDVDLASVVHLAPTQEPFGFSAAQERSGLLAGLRDGIGGVAGAVGRVAGDAGGLVVGAGSAATAAFGSVTTAYLDHMVSVAEGLPPFAVGSAALAYVEERRRCDPSAPGADGSGGSGHRAMVVAGIDSRTGADGASVGLPTGDLGYFRDEVTYFSYAAEGGAYEKQDTYSPILTSAQRLAAQLRELQRRDPGREVDLLAHSQGGVVVLAFLKLVYEAEDPSYPPLGTVVTFSSPLEGAPLATTAGDIRHVPGGPSLLAWVHEHAPVATPDMNSAAGRDLAEDSEFMARLDAAPVSDGIDLTTIGSTYDFVVPADHASSDDARQHTVIETGIFSGHKDVVTDEDATRSARAALEGAALPCRSFGAFIAADLIPRAISSVESGAVGFPGASNLVVGR
jgi:hypothetical protein